MCCNFDPVEPQFGIRVYKQYFNFSAAHFLFFKNGSREPLHGHNYRVEVRGNGQSLNDDLLFDFLHLKPIVRDLCQRLDHKLLLPSDNPFLKIVHEGEQVLLSSTEGHGTFSLPRSDVLFLPLSNTSAERLAAYLANEIAHEVERAYKFKFEHLEVEVEETPGQSAIYRL